MIRFARGHGLPSRMIMLAMLALGVGAWSFAGNAAASFARPDWEFYEGFPLAQHYSFRHPIGAGVNSVELHVGSGEWVFSASGERMLPGLEERAWCHELWFEGPFEGQGVLTLDGVVASGVNYQFRQGRERAVVVVRASNLCLVEADLRFEAEMWLTEGDVEFKVADVVANCRLTCSPPLMDWEWPLKRDDSWSWSGELALTGEIQLTSALDDGVLTIPLEDSVSLDFDAEATYAQCHREYLSYRVHMLDADAGVLQITLFSPEFHWHTMRFVTGLEFPSLGLRIDDWRWVALPVGSPTPVTTPTPPSVTPTPTPVTPVDFPMPQWSVGMEWQVAQSIDFAFEKGAVAISGVLSTDNLWQAVVRDQRFVAICEQAQMVWALNSIGPVTLEGRLVVEDPIRLDHDFRCVNVDWDGEMLVRDLDLNLALIKHHIQADVELMTFGEWSPIGRIEIYFSIGFCPLMDDFHWPLRIGDSWQSELNTAVYMDFLGDLDIFGLPFWVEEETRDGFGKGIEVTVDGSAACASGTGAHLSGWASDDSWQFEHAYCRDLSWYGEKMLPALPLNNELAINQYRMTVSLPAANAPPMTATPTPIATSTVSPTPTPDSSPAPTTPPSPTWLPGLDPRCRLIISARDFTADDPFILKLIIDNPSVPRYLHLYLLLQVADQYFAYPSWDLAPPFEHETHLMEECSTIELTPLQFTWPKDAGQGGELHFHAALVSPVSGELVSNVATTSFSYH